MNNLLNDIKFYEVARKRPQGEKKRKWVRRTHKDAAFNQKVKVIKMRAEIINKKLVNY